MTDKTKQRRGRDKTLDLGSMVYGKIPPQAREVEEVILGAILMESGAFETVSALLAPECFYVDAHQRIFRAMQEMVLKNQPLDIMTVIEELRKKEEIDMVGGPYYVTKLTNNVVSSANIEKHAHIVYEKYLLREMIRINGQMIAEAFEDSTDAFNLMDRMENEFQHLSLQRSNSTVTGIDTELVARFQRILELQQKDSHLTGIPSGFPDIDRITHGWQPTDLIVLAARPSVGKTALALNLARNAPKSPTYPGRKTNVLLFSLEMSKGQLVDRILSAESEIWLEKIMTGRMEEHQIKQLHRYGIQPLAEMGIYMDDTAALNVFELRAKTRHTMKKYGGPNVDWIIIIDYLQLMSGLQENRNGNREQEISTISRNLKKMAKDLKVPVIALSQLSREVEKRGAKDGKKSPQLSDLRESGAIEQDADMVMFLYRPEYYDITVNEMGDNTQGLTELSIAKHRNGNLANGVNAIKLKALLHIQKFLPWDGDLPSPADTLGPGAWKPIKGSTNELPFDTKTPDNE